MRKFLSLVLGFVFILSAIPAAAETNSSAPILVTAYRQVGWGDAVQIGYIDESGELWFIDGYDNELNWPYDITEQLAWLAAADDFESLGTLDESDLSALRSLVECVDDMGAESTAAANDAGTETSYAIRYIEGEARTVMLGMSGDKRFENLDVSAQALYACLRAAFPNVTSYFGESMMAPKGFIPVSLVDFCGYGDINLHLLSATRTDIDCEASTESVILADTELEELVDFIESARVTGKRGSIVATGGSVVYTFFDADVPVAEFEFFNGYLVMKDGTYVVE